MALKQPMSMNFPMHAKPYTTISATHWSLKSHFKWLLQDYGYLYFSYLYLENTAKIAQLYSQTTLLFIQDSKKTRNNSSTESINHSLRLRLTHAHICSIGFKSGLYAGSQRILCPCCSNNS